MRLAQVLAPARSPFAFDGLALGGTLRRRGRAGIQHGRDQNLPGQRRLLLVARHHADASSQIGARLFTGQIERSALSGQLGALLVSPQQHLVAQLQRTRKRMLGCQRIGQRHHRPRPPPASCRRCNRCPDLRPQRRRHGNAAPAGPLRRAACRHTGVHGPAHRLPRKSWCRYEESAAMRWLWCLTWIFRTGPGDETEM